VKRGLIVKTVWLLIALLFLPLLPVPNNEYENQATFFEISDWQENPRIGQYASKLIYNFIEPTESIVCLLNGEIDFVPRWYPNGASDSLPYQEILENELIETSEFGVNSLAGFFFNCEQYPYNLTEFRRALAHAINKTSVNATDYPVAKTPFDSPVPVNSMFCMEDELPYHYYDANVTKAEQLLNSIGITDYDDDGYRESPDGEEILIEVITTEYSRGYDSSVQVLREAATSLGFHFSSEVIDSTLLVRCPYQYLDSLRYYNLSFGRRSIEWLRPLFSGVSKGPYRNPCRFTNETLIRWLESLDSALTFDEARKAAFNAQLILQEECPMIRIFQDYYVSAHRTDNFQGFLESSIEGFNSFWNPYHCRLNDDLGGPYGGSLRIGVANSSLNPTLDHRADASFLNLLYDTVARMNIDGGYEPWLVQDILVETHSENPAVAEGHVRYTCVLPEKRELEGHFICQNWTDGHTLTSEDIVSTYLYFKQNNDSWFHRELGRLHSVVALTERITRIEFKTEAYWNIETLAHIPILPSHILGIQQNYWSRWSTGKLEISPEETMSTHGPYILTEYAEGEFVELTFNSDYFLATCRCTIWQPTFRVGPENGPPEDILMGNGTAGNWLEWNLLTTIPHRYAIYVDGSCVDSGLWNGRKITFNIDDLQIGNHNVTVWVSSLHFLMNADSVNVEVITLSDYLLGKSVLFMIGFSIGPISALIIFFKVIEPIGNVSAEKNRSGVSKRE
jgi:peptide/nickel transport system substrate-binding protein